MSRLTTRCALLALGVSLIAVVSPSVRTFAQAEPQQPRTGRRNVAPAIGNTVGGTLTQQAEQMLDDRNLRGATYNGVKFLALIAQGKLNQADGVFLMRGRMRNILAEGQVLATLREMDFQPPFTIQCVGFNAISLDAVTLLYVGTTEHGPVGVKLYIYKHAGGVYIGRVDATADWTELELMTETVTRLPAPLVINVTPSKDESGPGDVQGGVSGETGK